MLEQRNLKGVEMVEEDVKRKDKRQVLSKGKRNEQQEQHYYETSRRSTKL